MKLNRENFKKKFKAEAAHRNVTVSDEQISHLMNETEDAVSTALMFMKSVPFEQQLGAMFSTGALFGLDHCDPKKEDLTLRTENGEDFTISNRAKEGPINKNRKGIEQTDIYLAIFTDSFIYEERCMFEIGLAMLQDKPIMLVVLDGTQVPEHLKKIATIEYAKRGCSESVKAASSKLLETYKREQGIE
jgi:nucleoside 2-deoxyribosyltransferase